MNTLTKNILISLGVSLLFHLLIFCLFFRMRVVSLPGLSGMRQKIEEKRYQLQLRRHQENEKSRRRKNEQGEVGNDVMEEDNTDAEKALAKVFERQQLVDPYPIKLKLGKIEKMEVPKSKAPLDIRPATAPRPELVRIQSDAWNLRVPNHALIPEVERKDVDALKLPSLLPHGELSGEAGGYDVGMRMGKPSFRNPRDVDASELSRGITGIHRVSGDALRRQGVTPSGSILPFDDFVNVRMLVKDDPVGGGGYFVVSLEANEKSRSVREIPKDILLVIDCSGSITNPQFDAFKKASYRALDSLHYTDRFNVVAFTSFPKGRFKVFVPATPANKELAKSFIRGLSNQGTTSVFGAIEPYIRRAQRQTSRPLNIFLMTDGVSTVNIYTDDEFLRQVEGINPGHVSIFPMSVGNDARNGIFGFLAQEANRDLMDFLGFQNRGACLHTAGAAGADDAISEFISSHNDLLVRNLEYIAEESMVRNLYPRRLQHLYRNSNVRLFGKFTAGDSSIILDVVGYDSQNQRRSLIFQGIFAECQRTNEPLDSIWAARKLLELVSRKMVAKSAADKKKIDAEIRSVSEAYNLDIVY